tara:strand:- start:700 stop:915 length:216 start_codon:yes stop_codon:yes gene_type:complete
MTSKEDLMQQYRQMIEALQTENKNLKQRLDWYNDFVDYVQQQSNNIYNEACVHADYMEETIHDEMQDEKTN